MTGLFSQHPSGMGNAMVPVACKETVLYVEVPAMLEMLVEMPSDIALALT